MHLFNRECSVYVCVVPVMFVVMTVLSFFVFTPPSFGTIPCLLDGIAVLESNESIFVVSLSVKNKIFS